MTRSIGCVLLVIGCCSSSACSEPPDPRRTNFKIEKPGITVHYDPKTGHLNKVEQDLNKDGTLETFSYWDGTKVLRIEIDQDQDGKIDRWEHYDDLHHLASVGSSSRDDGVEDTWTYADASGLQGRVETDTDRDGHIDKRETFSENASGGRVLTLVESKIDASGVAHERLYYKLDGSFDRMETVK